VQANSVMYSSSNPRAQEAATTTVHEGTVGTCRTNDKVQQNHCYYFSSKAPIKIELFFSLFCPVIAQYILDKIGVINSAFLLSLK